MNEGEKKLRLIILLIHNLSKICDCILTKLSSKISRCFHFQYRSYIYVVHLNAHSKQKVGQSESKGWSQLVTVPQ